MVEYLAIAVIVLVLVYIFYWRMRLVLWRRRAKRDSVHLEPHFCPACTIRRNRGCLAYSVPRKGVCREGLSCVGDGQTRRDFEFICTACSALKGICQACGAKI